MSSLSITVTYSAGSVVIQNPSQQTIQLAMPGQVQVIQLGTLSSAVNQQITAAVAASAASASEAATSATSSATSAIASAVSAAASLSAYTAIANGTAPNADTLNGSEIIPMSRGSGLLQTTLTPLAQFAQSLTLTGLAANGETGSGASSIGWDNGNIAAFFTNHVDCQLGNFSLLAAVDVTKYLQCFTQGYYNPGDGGNAAWVYNAATSQSSANGITIIASTYSGASGCWLMLFAGELNAKACGAYGSNQSVLTVTTSGSVDVHLLSIGDFQNGQNVVIYNAGTLCTLAVPSISSVTQGGTAGSTSYTYQVVALDGTGAATAASIAITTTTGNATLSRTNYNIVSWNAIPGAVEYAIFCTGVGCVGLTQGMSFNDIGFGAINPIYLNGGSGIAPVSATGGFFYTTIVSGAGTQNIVVANTAPTSVNSHTMVHNDAPAIINAVSASGAVYLPTGNYQASGIVVNGKNIRGDSSHLSLISSIDKTKPIVQSYNISSVVGLGLSHRSWTYWDSYPNCIGLQLGNATSNIFSERTSRFENLLVSQSTEALSTRVTAYSNIFRNIEITQSQLPINMQCPSATGNVFDNIYIDNWYNYSASIKMTVTNMISLGGAWSESTFRQINCEWCTVTGAVVLLNGFNNATFDSVHFEGLTFAGNPVALWSLIGNGAASQTFNFTISSFSLENSTISSSSSGLAMFEIANYVNIDATGIETWNNTGNSATTWQIYRGGNTSLVPSPRVKLRNLTTDIFTQGSFAPVASGATAILLPNEPTLGDTAPTNGTGLSSGAYQVIQHSSANGALFYAYNGTTWNTFGPSYVEGTFNPTLAGTTIAGTFIYATQNAWYKKIGAIVTIGGILDASSITTNPTGNAIISISACPYLPINSSNGYSAVDVSVISGFGTLSSGIVGIMTPNSGQIALYYANGSGVVSASVFTAASYLIFGASFSVD